MKSMNTYLIFGGHCHRAMEFCRECLGGTFFMQPHFAVEVKGVA